MEKKMAVEKTKAHVRRSLANEEPGHDWFHVERVWKMAKRIGKEERADMFVVEMAALLHDIADWKFHGIGAGPAKARVWMESLGMNKKDIDHVIHIIENISFKGSGEAEKMKTTEGKIVQDADRLDALGAMGIARVFVFAGHKRNKIFDPKIKIKNNMKFATYKKSGSPAINHFYEKLLLLKNRMNTKTGKKIAEDRHSFMLAYLEQFFKEWNGEK